MSEITYALAGSEPENWQSLRIFNKDTGEELPRIHEVDTQLGWAFKIISGDTEDTSAGIACSRNPPCALCPPTTHARTELIFGNFVIVDDGTPPKDGAGG